MISRELYKFAEEQFDKKIENYNFYGCEDFKWKLRDQFLDRVDEFCEELSDIEIHIDYELENFNYEEARREELEREEIDRICERNRDAETDFYLTR